jgi:hypothetical protein
VANGKPARNPFKAGNGQPLIEKAETKRERFPTFGEEMALMRVCVGEGERSRAPPPDYHQHRRVINVRAFNAKTRRLIGRLF